MSTDRPTNNATERDQDDAPPVRVPVRRAPKVIPFLLTGAVLGIIAAAIVANLPDDSGQNYSTGTAFGYLAVLFGAIGALLAGVVVVLLDRFGGRH